jgi:glycerol-3-phosphate dehydrogenase subunit C
MPNLDGGDVEAARDKARVNVASLAHEVKLGRKIVFLQPTCGYVIRKEWSELFPTEDTHLVSKAAVDVMELLDQQRRDGTLSKDFAQGLGRVAYHAPCHLRAQKVGYPGVRVLSAVPNTDVEVIEQCSAVDGTWGMKAQHYDLGRRYAQKLTRSIEATEPQVVVTDCALSGQRIFAENRRTALHPIEALAQAYGIVPTIH